MKQNCFLVHFVPTDGNNGAEGAHEETFDQYAGLGTSDLKSIAAHLTKRGKKDLADQPISDFLHLEKNARARQTLGQLYFNADTSDMMTATTLTKSLPLHEKNVFHAKKVLDLLKDDLAIQMFILDHHLWIWAGGGPTETTELSPEMNIAGTYFLLLFTSLSLAEGNEALSAKTRLDLI
jgi:hypothetical protein